LTVAQHIYEGAVQERTLNYLAQPQTKDLNLYVKQRNHLNYINSLIINGVVSKDHKHISNYCEEFCKNLYRSRHSQQNLDFF